MASSPARPKMENYFYVLAQTWSPTMKHKLPQRNLNKFCYWILHGLWLNRNQNERLSTYHVYPDKDYRTDIAGDEVCSSNLKVIWPALIKGDSDEDYQHKRLEKHGVTAIQYNEAFHGKGIIDPRSYFCTAANLAVKYNVGQYLKAVNINEQHSVKHLIDEIQQKFGREPYIKLHPDPDDPNPILKTETYYLDQIYLYFDWNLNPIDTKRTNHTNIKITYPGCGKNLNSIDVPTQPNPCADAEDETSPNPKECVYCAHKSIKSELN